MSEVPQTSLSKKDILAAFGERVLWHPEKVEKEYLGLDEGLMKRDLVAADIADQYDQVQLDDAGIYDPHSHLSEEFLSRFKYYNRAEKPLNVQLLKQGSDPISLVAGKYMEELEDKEGRHGKSVLYSLFTLKGDFSDENPARIKQARADEDTVIGNFQMQKTDDDTFFVKHRIVSSEYRGPQNNSGEKVGDVMLKTCEQIAESYAAQEGRAKTIEIDAEKLDTLLWACSNDYKPKTSQDQERLQRVLNADENLLIVDDLFIWEKDKWEKRDWESDADVFSNREDSFKIILEKKIEPDKEGVIKSARSQIDKKTGD